MARTTKPLTNTEVKQAKAKLREYNLADGNGLYLRVKPNGSKLWLFNYTRPYSKSRANLGLGSFPDISLASARIKRQQFRELLANGIDPKQHRDEQYRKSKESLSNTLEQVFLKWLEVKKGSVSPAYAEDISRSFTLHVLPKLGKVPVHKISARTAIEILEPIAAKGALETVKRLCQRLNEVMVFAANSGILASNPLSGVHKAFQSPKKQNMPSLKADELPRLIQALSNANLKLTTRCVIEWQLHTMTRPSEAAGAQWSEINLKKQTWEIPAARMKKQKPHVIPLTDQCLTILETMKPVSGHREFIFPSDRKPRSHINAQTANMALNRMGFGGQLVAHGMRSLASTILNEHEFDPDVIEAALAHVDKNSVRAAYNRAEYLERRRKMMAWWSDKISEAKSDDSSTSKNLGILRLIS